MPHQCTNCGKTFDDGSKEMLSGCPDCGGNKFQFQPSAAKTSSPNEAAEPPTEPAQPESAPTAGRDADDREEANGDEPNGDEHVHEEGTDTDSPATHGGMQVDTTGEEDRAQRDARSTHATADELEEARRKMAESTEERRSDVADGTDEEQSSPGRSTRGRGAPQGPPTEPPDEEAAEEFGLSGAVGPSDEQPQRPTSEKREPAEGAMGGSDTDLSALREELNDQFESIKITAPGQYELNLMELYDRKEYIISLQEDGRYVVDIPEGHTLED